MGEDKLREFHEGSKNRWKAKIKELVEDYNKLTKEYNELEEELESYKNQIPSEEEKSKLIFNKMKEMSKQATDDIDNDVVLDEGQYELYCRKCGNIYGEDWDDAFNLLPFLAIKLDCVICNTEQFFDKKEIQAEDEDSTS